MLPIRQTLEDLPRPAPQALAHSQRLTDHVHAEITAAGGVISFERYMELALYAPGLGYYSAGARKFGAAGDFVTAPELSPLFAQCLAAQCAQVLAELGGGDILELGAGSGRMAADMLNEFARLGTMPDHYLILEVSADLRERQREEISRRASAWLNKVKWLDQLPESISGVILGNEVLDALPVARFRRLGGSFEEFCVTNTKEALNNSISVIPEKAGIQSFQEPGHRLSPVRRLNQSLPNDKFAWCTRPASQELQAALSAIESTLPQPFDTGYESEVCLRLPALIRSLAGSLSRGVLLLTDYGYPRAAYYHPDRHMGTLMCHYRQRAHEDPFLYPGLQDITAHVDFTAVADAGIAAGLELAGYTTQAHFLLALGIAERATDLRTAREVKLLTLPEEMGERFKAIGFSKGLDPPLRGFLLRDLSHTL